MLEQDICIWYTASREQRETELERHEGFKGTESYKRMGCYKCNGLDEKCELYLKISHYARELMDS